jgi:hypothetical protein
MMLNINPDIVTNQVISRPLKLNTQQPQVAPQPSVKVLHVLITQMDIDNCTTANSSITPYVRHRG